ncbi:glycosyltransferase family 4 protein [Thiorhodovibrio litoralis]|uniref:glycosyltransferase family 4 protein n=1 Tax=Thiorhodovibrio litoralis TaxID=2952932 RepID=UPI002B25B763|nr:glycosyltransferase family 4 protein [Thiorhodovibrio litoralis]WPL10855.1 Glycosyltransferase KanE [Thiorhodovibrio litoralis]
MNLSVIFHSWLFKDGSGYWCKDVYGIYFEKLAERFDLNLVATVKEDAQTFSTRKFSSDHRIVITHLPNNPLSKMAALWNGIRNAEFVLIFMPTYSGAFAGVVARISGIPYAVYHGIDWVQNTTWARRVDSSRLGWLIERFEPFWIRWWDMQLIRGSRFVLTAGGQLQEKYQSLGLRVIPTVPIIQFARRDLCVPKKSLHSPIRLLYVGGLMVRKGVQDLLSALTKLRGRLDFTLTLVGDGPDRRLIEKKVKALGLDQQVHLAGFVAASDELKNIYRTHDIFVLPSYAEGFPRVLYEAALFGLPILTTDVNGIPYLLQDEHSALFLRVGGIEDIANKVGRICEDTDLRCRIAKEANQIVTDILDCPAWQQHGDLILSEMTNN